MYIPDYHNEKNLDRIAAFVKAHPFGTLITNGPTEPVATHLPFLIERGNADNHLVITGHMARANPHWKLAREQSSLLVFQEPHAYISTGLYADKQTVPTWNYIAVHLTGKLIFINDHEQLLTLMTRSIKKFGSDDDCKDWEHLGKEVVNRLIKDVVAFEFQISGIQARFKLSQNKGAQDRQAVRNYLLGSEDPMHRELGQWMEK